MISLANYLQPNMRQMAQRNSIGGQDSITLHVNPQEANKVIPQLLQMGGSGRFDPITHGIHFDAGGDGSGDDAGGGDSQGFSSGDGTGSAGGEGYSSGPDGSPGGVGPSETGNEFNGLNGLGTVDANTAAGWAAGVSADADAAAAEAAAGRTNGYDLGAALGFGPSRSAYVNDAAYNNALSEAGLNANYGMQGQGTGLSTVYNTDMLGHATNTGKSAYQSWVEQNPGLNATLAGILSAVNPALGAMYSLGSGIATGKGGQAIGSTIGNMAAPGFGAFTGMIGSLADGKSGQQALGGFIGNGIGAALNGYGFNLGNYLGPAGATLEGQAAGKAGGAIASGIAGLDGSNTSQGGSTDSSDSATTNGGINLGPTMYMGGSPTFNEASGANTGVTANPSGAPAISNAGNGYGALPTSFQNTQSIQTPILPAPAVGSVAYRPSSLQSEYDTPKTLADYLKQMEVARAH